MSCIRTYLLVVIASVLAGMIGAAFGTGTAQAVVSTLVSVVNPTTSPVASLNVTDPGRIAYQSEAPVPANCFSGAFCDFAFGPVPVGHRVVVQHIAGFFQFSPVPTYVNVFASSPAPETSFYTPVSNNGDTTGTSAFDQPVLLYVDSGQTVTVEAELFGNSGAFLTTVGLDFVAVSGYELDCTVANCAAIASQ